MLKREMFDVVGLAVQKETRTPQTAESKAWDYQHVRQFLACRVELLEQLEAAVWKLLGLYDPTVTVPEISYNRDFAVIDLKNSIEGLLQLSQISQVPAYRNAVARAAVTLLEKYHKLPVRERDALLAGLESGAENAEATL